MNEKGSFKIITIKENELLTLNTRIEDIFDSYLKFEIIKQFIYENISLTYYERGLIEYHVKYKKRNGKF